MICNVCLPIWLNDPMRNVQIRITARTIDTNIVYGEELYGYVPYSSNDLARSVLTRDPLYHVKMLTAQITSTYYEGDERFVDLVATVYSDLSNARKEQGLKGMQGINLKGMVCAILYFVLLWYQKSRIDMDRLIRAANTIQGASSKVTSRMVNKYMIQIVDLLSKLNNNNNNNSNIRFESFIQEIKRLAFQLKYTTKDVNVLNKEAKLLIQTKPNLLEQHRPSTVAQALVYRYTLVHPRPNAKERLKITPYIQRVLFPKLGISVNVSIVHT